MKQRIRKALVAVAGLALAAFTPFAASAGEAVYEMGPYVSMGLDISTIPSGTFLTTKPVMAFPGYTLQQIKDLGLFGCMTGGYMTKGLGATRNFQLNPTKENPTDAVCSLNYVDGTVTKAVVIYLSEFADGVKAQASGARYVSTVAPDTLFAKFNAAGNNLDFYGTGQAYVTSDGGKGYGLRGLTLTRFLDKTKPVLAFKNATLEDLADYRFSGYSCGLEITKAKSEPMLGYNAKLVGEGADQKLRVEMQIKDDGHVKCVILEFTDGEDGVYATPVAARYQTGADCGFKFVNDDGTYNGTAAQVANDFSMVGYGVFRLRAEQPPQNVAVWTGAAGDGDIWNEMNWKDEIPPTDETTVQMGGDIYMNWPEEEVTLDCAAIEFTSAVKLTDNCDWSGMPVTPDMRGFPLDLNGKQLTVTKMMDGTVKDSTTEDPGQLIVSVAEDEETENTTMALTGNAQLVKKGAGTYIHSIATTIGLARVDGGTFKLGTNKIATQITVGGGATLDVNGKVDTEFKLYLEDDATLTNTGAECGTGSKQITGGIELAENATAYITSPSKRYCLIAHNYAQITVTLNGGTLIHSGTGNFQYINTKFVGPGTLKGESGTIYIGYKGFACTDDFVIEVGENSLFDWSQASTLPTLIGTGTLGGQAVTVTKLCGPIAFNSSKTARAILGNGATNDLSGVEGTYDATRFTFNATANIKIGDREIEADEKLISWTTQPTSTAFTFTDYEGELVPEAKADGLYASEPPQDVAVWTGAAGDGDVLNPDNWEGGFPTESTTVQIGGDIYMNWPSDSGLECAAIEFTSDVKLTNSCDWSGMPVGPDMKGFPLDLNGKQLTVAQMMTGTVTDLTTDTANPGQLIVTVAEDEETENTTMALTGNLRLVKIGAGTFIANKTQQSYTGGTLVSEGTLKLPPVDSALGYLGANASPITVEKNATFNINGVYGVHVYSAVILNGGTLRNERVDQTNYNNGGLGNVTLTADSQFDLAASVLFYQWAGLAVDLGGHRLTVTSSKTEGNALFSLNPSSKTSATVIRNGVLEIGEGVTLDPRAASINLTDASIVMKGTWDCHGYLFTVKDLDITSAGNNKQVNVSGTFRSANSTFGPVNLLDGATLDLSGNEGALEAAEKLTFAAGEIAVNVTGRTISEDDQLVSWTIQPTTTTFAFTSPVGDLVPEAEAEGLYARNGAASKEVDKGYWTGLGGDGDPLNPANWACTNSVGKVVEGGLPTNETATVVLNGPLTQNLDWTTLGAFAFADDSIVDLNGFALTVGGFRNSTTGVVITNGVEAAETPAQFIVNVVDKAATNENTSVAIAGNVQLGKKGEGTYVHSVTTPNCVVRVDAGTFKLGTNKIAKTITVGEGATLDVNGQIKTDFKLYLEDGATLTNTGVDGGYGKTQYQIGGGLELAENATAYITSPVSHHMIASGWGQITATLNGGTLITKGPGYFDCINTKFVGPGKVKVEAGSFYVGLIGFACTDDFVIELNADTTLSCSGKITLPTLIGSGKLTGQPATVTKLCGPVSVDTGSKDAGVTLGDGATLDLSKVEGTFAATRFTFKATANIKIGDRAIEAGDKLISWGTKPSTEFAFTGYEGELEPVAEADGLYARKLGVAKIGDVYYPTLNAALEAAEAGQTVTLCKNITTDAKEPFTVNKDITLDFATFTVEKTVANDYTFDIPDGATVVFTGTTGGAKQTQTAKELKAPASMIRNKGNLTIAGGVYTSDFCIIKNDEDPGAGVLTVTGGTFNIVPAAEGFADKQWALMNWATATIEGGTWNGVIGTRSCDRNAASKAGTTEITGELSGTPSYLLLVGYTGDTTWTNFPKIKGVALADVTLEKNPSVTDTLFLVESGDYVTVAVAEAKIGDVYYITLKAANDAAEDGDTIELVKSAEGDGIFVTKDVTFDFGGFTYTLAGMPVGSTGYETQGFHIEAANCTLSNGTINCSAANRDKTWAEGATVAEKGIAMLVQNYASLTVADMTLDGTNLAKAYYGKGEARKPGANYTLSNCSGTTTIAGTTISARDGESFAFDSDKTAKVTLNSGTVNGKIEVCASLTINGGEINGPTNGEAYDGKAVITVAGGTLVFNAGTLTATGSGDSGMYGVYVKNGGTATFGIEGQGGPSVEAWFAAIGANNTTSPCTITVNGGTYTQKADGTGQTWHYFCAAVYAPAAGTYTINGGTFDGALYCVASRYVDAAQTITFNAGTFSDPLFVDEESGATTGTRTITKLTSLTVDLADPANWEWKGDGSSNYATLTKKSDTPTIPEEQGKIEPVPGKDNTYVVSNATDTVDISNLPSDATVIVDVSVNNITGVTSTEQIQIVAAATNETSTTFVDITDAFTITPGTGTSATIVLNPAAEVTIQIGSAEPETIPVTPTAIEPEEGGIAEGEVATKAIPGLTYTLKRGTELGKYNDPVASEKANSTTVTLKDGTTKPADKAFYVIEVTK